MGLTMKWLTQEGQLPWKPRTTGDSVQLLMHALFPDFGDLMDYFPRFSFKDNFPDFLISVSWSRTRRVYWRFPLAALWNRCQEKNKRVTSPQSQRRNSQWLLLSDYLYRTWYPPMDGNLRERKTFWSTFFPTRQKIVTPDSVVCTRRTFNRGSSNCLFVSINMKRF